MTTTQDYRSFQEFWPHYVREHSLGATRRLHFIGTLLALLSLALAVLVDWRWLGLVPVAGYGFAWYGHFFIQRNRPATFTHPAWSLAGDLRMFWLMLRGRMNTEVDKCLGARGQGPG